MTTTGLIVHLTERRKMTIIVSVFNVTGVKLNEIQIESSLTSFRNMLVRVLPTTLDYKLGRCLLINSFTPRSKLRYISSLEAKYICKYLRDCVFEHGLHHTCTDDFLNLLDIFHTAIKHDDHKLRIRSVSATITSLLSF